jgi:hypothetical protein
LVYLETSNYSGVYCAGLDEMITKEQREKFINDFASRIIEIAGWPKEDALAAANAADIDDLINEGFDGEQAADDEMSYWTDDE